MAARSSVGIIRETLPNGLRVIVEPLRDFSSVCVGLWVLTGSRDEDPGFAGVSHLIEHLSFKGTATRSAKQIALEIDSLGGTLNAFTGKELTSYYAKVLGDSLPQALDVLSDVTINSAFREEDIDRERDIILQEISMVEDAPEDFVHDLHSREFWSSNSLGQPILGTVSSLGSIDRESVLSHYNERYRAGSMILTAAGNIDPEGFIKELDRYFGSLNGGEAPEVRICPKATLGTSVLNRSLEQVHLCAGFEGLAVNDERRYGLFLLNAIFGGGMSSRLFQKIREEHSLAYSVFSYLSAYEDSGMLTVYCGTSDEGFPKTMELIKQEAERLAAEPVSENELAVAKRQLKGNLLLGQESTSNRMSQLARNEIFYGRQITPDQIAVDIEAVTREEILQIASSIIDLEKMAVTIIGPVSEDCLDEIRG